MNRQLKFKVWNGIEWIGIINVGNTPDTNDFNKWEDLIFCQFTDLIDKNNKEIYEGDIVKVDLNHEISFFHPSLKKYTKGTVEWVCRGFNVCQKNVGRTPLEKFATCSCCPGGLEIIGNIFENKELIE